MDNFDITESSEPSFVPSSQNGIGGSSELSAQILRDSWNAIEKKLSKSDLDVLDALILLSRGNSSTLLKDFTVMGEEMYMNNRDILKISCVVGGRTQSFKLYKAHIHMKKTEEVSVKGKTKKKGTLNKAKQIQLENSKKRATEEITKVLDTFKLKELMLGFVSNSNIVEIKGIGLLYACMYLDHHKESMNKPNSYPQVFDVMRAVEKYINISAGLESSSMLCTNDKLTVSTTLINDLTDWLNYLKTVYPYNGININKFAPELLVRSSYDKLVPNIGIVPKAHQRQIVDAIRKYIDTGAFLVYNPMIGSGKTTSAVAVGSLLSTLRKVNPAKYGKKKLLFACNLQSVRLQVANITYNADVFCGSHTKFAMSHMDHKRGTYKIVKSNITKTDEDVVTIVASPEVATQILSDPEVDKEDYVLFVDEPTIGADCETSKSLEHNVRLMTVAPSLVIYSSATFPDLELINSITEDFSQKYPDAYHGLIYSDEIQIGCDISTYDGSMVVPHLGVHNKEELTFVIDTIVKCPFLGRIYTSNVVQKLYNSMKENEIPTPNIDEYFQNVDNLTSNSVRKAAMGLLKILATSSDEIIDDICSTSIVLDSTTEPELSPIQESSSSFQWLDEDADRCDVITDPIEMHKLGTIQHWRFQNPTLIATPTPERFVFDNFSDIVNDVYTHTTPDGTIRDDGSIGGVTYRTTGDAMRKYKTKMDAHKKRAEQISKNAKGEADERDKLAEHDKLKPKFDFPDFGHIGSVAHINKYAKTHKRDVVGRFVRPPMCITNLPYDNMNVPDFIITALFCGVGIYSSETVKDGCYLQAVLDLASSGTLAYIVADSTICYGTNYPISNVIITDEFALQHSINTLFQLMGRAGRVGRSWQAKICVTQSIAQRIINYTKNMSEASIEATNMVNKYNSILLQQEEDKQKRIDDLIAKATPAQQKKHTCVVIAPSGNGSLGNLTVSSVARNPNIVQISEVVYVNPTRQQEHSNN